MEGKWVAGSHMLHLYCPKLIWEHHPVEESVNDSSGNYLFVCSALFQHTSIQHFGVFVFVESASLQLPLTKLKPNRTTTRAMTSEQTSLSFQIIYSLNPCEAKTTATFAFLNFFFLNLFSSSRCLIWKNRSSFTVHISAHMQLKLFCWDTFIQWRTLRAVKKGSFPWHDADCAPCIWKNRLCVCTTSMWHICWRPSVFPFCAAVRGRGRREHLSLKRWRMPASVELIALSVCIIVEAVHRAHLPFMAVMHHFLWPCFTRVVCIVWMYFQSILCYLPV